MTDSMTSTEAQPLWRPDAAKAASVPMQAFMMRLGKTAGVSFGSYEALHRWSLEHPGRFWQAVWDFCEVDGIPGTIVLAEPERMPGARWFPQARLNFAANLLPHQGEEDAIVFCGEEEIRRRISYAELHREVARFAAALKAAGVSAGDRVAAYMPNMPEAVIAMLAAASMGAIFSSASPDFGVQGVLDRFGQIEPKLLIAADGALYGGKHIVALERIAEIVAALPTVEAVVIVPYLHARPDISGIRSARMWQDFVKPWVEVRQIDFADLPFDHPLYIVFSSGTTGMPKCIVHGAGGTLLQHLKEHRLHGDIRRGDRVFYYTTCGWMMWNWLVSALASQATLLLYDGSPFAGRGRVLWDFLAGERCTHFGTSAKYLEAAQRLGLQPAVTHDLSALRMAFSTGSPLLPEGFDYVYTHIKREICLASISGGTDIVSCFVLGNPLLPVWRGEIQCKGLGMAVEVWNEAGRPVKGEKGELVCTRPFPSMPLSFWGDGDGARYRAAYFDRFPGVWHHGDWCEETLRGGFVIYGRSDATLNPGGVRIGTAEIYRQLERLPEIEEAVVIGQDWENDVRVVLFVRLSEGLLLDAGYIARIKKTLRENASPRHVPDRIVQVPEIPRTRNGKLVELAVRAAVHGEPVKNIESLANPQALAHFRDRPELRD